MVWLKCIFGTIVWNYNIIILSLTNFSWCRTLRPHTLISGGDSYCTLFAVGMDHRLPAVFKTSAGHSLAKARWRSKPHTLPSPSLYRQLPSSADLGCNFLPAWINSSHRMDSFLCIDPFWYRASRPSSWPRSPDIIRRRTLFGKQLYYEHVVLFVA